MAATMDTPITMVALSASRYFCKKVKADNMRTETAVISDAVEISPRDDFLVLGS